MKSIRIFIQTIFALTILSNIAFAQAPDKISYQAIIRDNLNNILSNETIRLRIAVLEGSIEGEEVYAETHLETTNSNGLITVLIGGGDLISGDFANIEWSAETFYLKIEVDPTGGTNYSISGVSPLVSVPYAMHAKTAESVQNIEITGSEEAFGNWDKNVSDDFDGDYTSLRNTPDLSIYSTTDTTLSEAEVDEMVSNNGYLTQENQMLSISGTFLSIENGNTVELPVSVNTDEQKLSFQNDTLFLTNGGSVNLSSLKDGIGTDSQMLFVTNETLAISNGNEIAIGSIDKQVLSISNDTVFLTNGGYIILPTSSDSEDNQNLESAILNGTVLSIQIENGEGISVDLHNLQDGTGTDNQSLYVANGNLYISGANHISLSEINTDNQQLSLFGDTLSLTNGGSVILPNTENATDDQVLIFDNLTRTLSIENGNSIDLSSLGNTQRLIVNGDLIGLTGNNPLEFIHKDNFDKQRLSLSGDTLKLTNGGQVLLPLLGTSQDNQMLQFVESNNTLSIENGNSIDLSSINTDNQNISAEIVGSTIYIGIERGNTIAIDLQPYIDSLMAEIIGFPFSVEANESESSKEMAELKLQVEHQQQELNELKAILNEMLGK